MRGWIVETVAACAVLAPLAAGCSNQFDPYSKLVTFRVLGVRAEPPSVLPGGSTVLTALTYVPRDSGSEVQRAWSWCPFTAGADMAYACAIDHDRLEKAIGMHIRSFDLGSTATVSYAYDLSPVVYQGACAALSMQNVPKYVELPKCQSSFPISIRLDAKNGDRTISTIKDVELEYTADAPVNHNPDILGVGYRLKTDTSSKTIPIGAGSSPMLRRNTDYTLVVDVPESASETYTETPAGGGMPVQKREILAITWFTEGGSWDKTRTGYIDGETPSFAVALTNVWTTPKKVDYPGSEVHLAFVIRDGRGGLGWLERDVTLED